MRQTLVCIEQDLSRFPVIRYIISKFVSLRGCEFHWKFLTTILTIGAELKKLGLLQKDEE